MSSRMRTLLAVPLQRLRFLSTQEVVESVRIGKIFSQNMSFTAADVKSYTQLTGDTNPIHSNPSAALKAGFGACVVPGMLCGSLFPAIIGSRFDGAVYISQNLKFEAPVLVGESILAEVEACSVVKLRQHAKVTFYTRCLRELEESKPVVVDGQAVALLPLSMVVD